jgi:hypothetical protein
MDDEQLAEPPPEVWDELPGDEADEREDPRQEIGYQPRATLQERLADVAERVEPTAKEFCSFHSSQVIRPLYAKCPRCEGERNRRQVDALRAVIVELKSGRPNPERERQLVKALHSYQHPDVKGLLDTLSARQASAGAGRSRL